MEEQVDIKPGMKERVNAGLWEWKWWNGIYKWM